MRKNLGPKTIMYPMPVLIIATYNEDGSVDAMNAAWGGIETDERIGICVSESHKTMENIKRNKSFTVSFGIEKYAKECDYLGLVSGNKVKDKFEKTGFTTQKSEFVNAPIINELKLSLECNMVSYDSDSCHLVGDIVNISADESIIDKDGKINIKDLGIITYDPDTHDYIKLGEVVGKAFSIGKPLTKK